jgi:surface protein
MSFAFDSQQTFNEPLECWNVGQVTIMKQMFRSASSFNQPIGDWDTSLVNTMASMFRAASSFNQPIGNWNTSKNNRMSGMFWGAASFNQPIDSWDVSQVDDMYRMFLSASDFNQCLGSWADKTPGNVKTNEMFPYSGCTSIATPNSEVGPWCQIEDDGQCFAPSSTPSSNPSTENPDLTLLSLSSSEEQSYTFEGWSRILVSGSITKTTKDSDSSISLSFDWKDQGSGNRKSKVRVILLSDDGTIIASKTYQPAPHQWETNRDQIDSDHDLAKLSEVGYTYAVEVMAGWGGGHKIYIRDFDLQTNFAFVSEAMQNFEYVGDGTTVSSSGPNPNGYTNYDHCYVGRLTTVEDCAGFAIEAGKVSPGFFFKTISGYTDCMVFLDGTKEKKEEIIDKLYEGANGEFIEWCTITGDTSFGRIIDVKERSLPPSVYRNKIL